MTLKAIIPKRTVYRLSVYLRCLDQLAEKGMRTVSSQALAQEAGVKPTQLRKDLTFFGHFGKRGLGYEVESLHAQIGKALGRTQHQPVVLVGVGNLGSALMAYKGFEKEGFDIVAGFDSDVRRKRRGKFGQPIYHLSKLEPYVRQRLIKMGILCVPPQAAQDIAQRLIGAGVTAILNFAPVVLRVPSGVIVSNVNLAIEMENLSYFQSLAGD